MRPARAKRGQRVNQLSDNDIRILVRGEYYFDGDLEEIEPKWRIYRDELLNKYSRPGFRPYAWWIFDQGVTETWLSWKDNVPLAERRKFRTQKGKVLSNKEYFGHGDNRIRSSETESCRG